MVNLNKAILLDVRLLIRNKILCIREILINVFLMGWLLLWRGGGGNGRGRLVMGFLLMGLSGIWVGSIIGKGVMC